MLHVHDFHTHNLEAKCAIINIPADWLLHPSRFLPREEAVYSAGIHPWWTEDKDDTHRMFNNLPMLLQHPQVVCVGECGIDRLRGAALKEQEHIFKKQVAMAEQVRLPVTLHIVRAFDVLLRLHKELHPSTQWTVHGFRGRPALARQLLDAGINLSFGSRHNADSWSLTPPERRHRETDEE